MKPNLETPSELMGIEKKKKGRKSPEGRERTHEQVN